MKQKRRKYAVVGLRGYALDETVFADKVNITPNGDLVFIEENLVEDGKTTDGKPAFTTAAFAKFIISAGHWAVVTEVTDA